ncbi:MAG: glycyl-tRNA synthetase beta chain [Candidatus Tokpelaia sp. JSC189]|nr:MAG: glycyl-tRNA synthetase beta chain [Candidatus Tokpelaia sp. JSC189]
MPDLLLELFSEEIPARIQRKAAGDLKNLVTKKLVDAGLIYEAAREYWTPCRLTLDIRGLTTKSGEIQKERKGPSINAPKAAIDGFLHAAKLDDISKAEIATDPKKGDYYIIRTICHGRKAQEIIADVLPDIIYNFPWPKSMRWGVTSAKPGALRWIRPLHSILCLFSTNTESEIIDFEIGDIRSSNVTYGHRFMSSFKPIAVHRFSDYAIKLEKAKVILDANRRKEIILTDARNLSFAQGLNLVEDEDLAEEVAGLVEWPVVLMGEFEERFLVIPPEIIRLTIRTNQKCFVTRKPNEKNNLSNHFILVSNIEAKDGGKEVAAGNGKIVRARIADALYFWRTDQMPLPDLNRLSASAERFKLDLKKPLDQRMARLDHLHVTFHTKLGTQGARVTRIAALAAKIAPLVSINAKLVRRAAVLAKADLQTEVVTEFPELQGIMGHKYALLQGESKNVSQAIEDHYKPQGPTDAVPHEPISIIVALADKIDTLVGFWLINERPTSSKDPYALRRAALGVIRLALAQEWNIHLMPLLQEAVQLLICHLVEHNLAAYEQRLLSDNTSELNRVQDISNAVSLQKRKYEKELIAKANLVLQDLLCFFHDRLKIYLREEGTPYDAINAVLTPQTDNFQQIVRRIEALIIFINTDNGKKLLGCAKRAANILDVETRKKTVIAEMVKPTQFLRKEEIVLYNAIIKAEKKIAPILAEGDFSAALTSLASLREPVDLFFEKIQINDKDITIRANRLALLARVRALMIQVADFSKLAG